ncbi:hypothetical protein BDR07DRAFT_1444292, partial [Suillus spraguei]
MKDIRGWWPQTISEAKDDDEINNQQGAKGPMAAYLERLVHIELKDLATHAPYLHPNCPNVCFSHAPRLPKAALTPCHDCNGTKHKEVFSFTRGMGNIVKPVIRKWGSFIMKYFAPSE